MTTVEYSVLSYSPSTIVGERINIGIVFYNQTSDYCVFEHTKKWSRLQSFDDELNIDFMKCYLEGIKHQLEPSVFDPKPMWRDVILNYANEFRFSSITKVHLEEEFENFVEETKKIYLRFDYAKENRPKEFDQIRYFKKIFRSNNIPFSGHPVSGIYEDEISYDFTISLDERTYGVKYFNFEDKNIRKMFTSIRSWAQIANEMDHNIKTVLIYDACDYANSDLNTALKILSSSPATVIPFGSLSDFLDKIGVSNNSKLLANQA